MPQPSRLKLLFVFGTRPEAIKLAPVIRYFREHRAEETQVDVCVTAQHREMLDQVLKVFDIHPRFDLNVMRPDQTLASVTGVMLPALERVLESCRPDLVFVQGDTTTTLCGALASFYARIPVAHIEAGLRTGDLYQPFPEEMNRVIVSKLTTIHFAATRQAAANLDSEGIPPERIEVTGNTGIDALIDVKCRLQDGELQSDCPLFVPNGRRMILVTAHRRENFGPGIQQICTALREIVESHDVHVVYPVHPNPRVSGPVRQQLVGHPRITLTEPLDYVSFIDLLRRAYLLLTDSGGIQEEAPSIGKPVLVLRDKTERPEAIQAGTAILVGTNANDIVANTERLLTNASEYERRSQLKNPYGDGTASARIAEYLFNSEWRSFQGSPDDGMSLKSIARNPTSGVSQGDGKR
jgi:UDP-N-acetylglucosamine 2-epimerase (non-hydrolysing)